MTAALNTIPALADHLGVTAHTIAGHADTLAAHHGDRAVIIGDNGTDLVLADWAAARIVQMVTDPAAPARVAQLRIWNPATTNFDLIGTRTLLPRTAAAQVPVYGPNYGVETGRTVQVTVYQDGRMVDGALVNATGPRVTDEAAAWIARDTAADRYADATS